MNLVQPVQLLCTECHDIDDELVLPYLHRPFALGYCSKCHDAHSGSDSWVLTKNSEELCLTCHKEEGSLAMHQHPYNVEPKNRLRADLQLSTRGRLECVSCHHPHSGSTAHLLRTSQKFTCIGCHNDK
jgi:predicted CXXCH cytochrome family protein